MKLISSSVVLVMVLYNCIRIDEAHPSPESAYISKYHGRSKPDPLYNEIPAGKDHFAYNPKHQGYHEKLIERTKDVVGDKASGAIFDAAFDHLHEFDRVANEHAESYNARQRYRL